MNAQQAKKAFGLDGIPNCEECKTYFLIDDEVFIDDSNSPRFNRLVCRECAIRFGIEVPPEIPQKAARELLAACKSALQTAERESRDFPAALMSF
jgi:hypothetical protein